MFFNSTVDSPELDEFRKEVRTFCRTKISGDFRRKLELGQHLEKSEHDAWLKALASRGWLAGNWPWEYGGLGWGPEQSEIFNDETARAGAPWLIPFGVTMVGPVIREFGSDEQKKRFLPDIVANNVWWCQGYSEPGSGSDLASLRTRAEKSTDAGGDHYIVNGQKIWTTLAHWADWIFCLVRTDPDARKQLGISFLLIDMKTPGITVRKIDTIDMGHHLNEVHFENVRVPTENLVGEENRGWDYAKFLLGHERAGAAGVGKFSRYMEQLRSVLAQTMEGGVPLSSSPNFRRKIADLEVRIAALAALSKDQRSSFYAAGAPSLIGAAALKLRASELQQEILQVMTDALARHGLAFQADALMASWNGELVGPSESPGLLYEQLTRRAATIYGGSSEIQREIIAKNTFGH